MISDPVAVLVVMAAVVWVAVRLEERYTLFRSLGSALVGILLAMVLSNVGLIPGESPTYELLMGPVVSVGIALILFSVDVRTVFSAGPKMLVAFAIGAVATAVGAIVGAFVWASAVGPETWKLAGQFTGTYTGGGLNFAALGQALNTSSDLFTAATAADVIVTAFWMAACLSAPLLFVRNSLGVTAADLTEVRTTEPDKIEPSTVNRPMDPNVAGGTEATTAETQTLERALYGSGRPLGLSDVSALVVLAMGAVVLAGWLGRLLPALPEVLWLTTLSLALAQVRGVRMTAGAAMLGNYLILLFLASNGARSIASQANVGGAASAMAMASARGYADKLLPGVAVGLLGYAVGNYSGFAVAKLLEGMLGG